METWPSVSDKCCFSARISSNVLRHFGQNDFSCASILAWVSRICFSLFRNAAVLLVGQFFNDRLIGCQFHHCRADFLNRQIVYALEMRFQAALFFRLVGRAILSGKLSGAYFHPLRFLGGLVDLLQPLANIHPTVRLSGSFRSPVCAGRCPVVGCVSAAAGQLRKGQRMASLSCTKLFFWASNSLCNFCDSAWKVATSFSVASFSRLRERFFTRNSFAGREWYRVCRILHPLRVTTFIPRGKLLHQRFRFHRGIDNVRAWRGCF